MNIKKVKSFLILFLFIFLTIFFLSFLLADEINGGVGYNGFVNRDGLPITGNIDIEFKIYDSLVGGEALWWSGIQPVSVIDGDFDYTLGHRTAFSDTLFDAQYLYLELIVEGDTLAPRENLLKHPFAIRAQKVKWEGVENAPLFITESVATANYLTHSSATLTYATKAELSIAGGITSEERLKWDAAYIWGDHEVELAVATTTLYAAIASKIEADIETATSTLLLQSDTSSWDRDSTDDFDGAYGSLSGAPTNVSSFTNDAGYLTTIGGDLATDLEVAAATSTISWGALTNLPANLDTDSTDDFDGAYGSLSGSPTNVSSFTNDAGYLTGVGAEIATDLEVAAATSTISWGA
ncbi:MAG: hypothetical protein GY830_02545, partial [Bacteroidetes bacterium]|nr:hypothetical protein [Bacteroidota bacterium]